MRNIIDVMNAIENIIPAGFVGRGDFCAKTKTIAAAARQPNSDETDRWEDLQRAVVELLPLPSSECPEWARTANCIFSGGEDYKKYLPVKPDEKASLFAEAALAAG